MIAALETDKKIIHKRVLKCVYWALIQGEYQIKIPRDKRMQLEKVIIKLMQSDDRSITNTSKEIYKQLNPNPSQQQNQQMMGIGGASGDINDMSQYNQMAMGGVNNQQMNFYHNMKQ